MSDGEYAPVMWDLKRDVRRQPEIEPVTLFDGELRAGSRGLTASPRLDPVGPAPAATHRHHLPTTTPVPPTAPLSAQAHREPSGERAGEGSGDASSATAAHRSLPSRPPCRAA